ncbi:hypothetical protein BDN70DRAFT_881999 [Pholiota conissans]|uniref:Secreted protein n=1 Tax=Pholiota conissans TaxID=109636 RepID=A0A9P5YZ84_9AGAR|nr:hypothetical protein BDN70DRAFT_881999 [Pholiota conissans]
MHFPLHFFFLSSLLPSFHSLPFFRSLSYTPISLPDPDLILPFTVYSTDFTSHTHRWTYRVIYPQRGRDVCPVINLEGHFVVVF